MVTHSHNRLVYLFAILCIAALPAAYGAAPETQGPPRDVVDHVATLIENNYFAADKAADIAKSLREAADSGQFDRFQDPRDLAAALTSRLQPMDHHFRVTWSPPERAAGARESAETSGPSLSLESLERRNAYGFHRVEMLPGAIGSLDITTFADFSFSNPNEPARKAADAALALVSTADAIIIDLRSNGGGS